MGPVKASNALPVHTKATDGCDLAESTALGRKNPAQTPSWRRTLGYTIASGFWGGTRLLALSR